ncbi:MAG: hypothetical protein GX250_00475 [Clostridiales bacterium]|jgi:hypothetical protein|nr:hypothetical protein [Clostridiales bacterium]
MKYCNTCRVSIRGMKERCVLCGNTVITIDNKSGTEEIFPAVPPYYKSYMAMRIMIFISLSAIVISYTIRLVFPTSLNWPIFVIFGIGSAWLSLAIIIQKGKSIPKVILWQVTFIPLIAVFWDWQTGWKGWSLDYLIPILYLTAEVVMYVTAKITKLSVRDYISYALLAGIFGIIPILFILFKWVNTPYPSITCAAVSLIFLMAIFIFQGDYIKSELHKRMHI